MEWRRQKRPFLWSQSPLAAGHGRCRPSRPAAMYAPPPLTIVHPPPDWALGEWVPVLCLDELIGKRCAASPHRLSCPHQDADLDNTPRCPRTHSPGVAQVWRRLENRFVWEEGLKNEVHEAKRNNNCPAHNVALLHFWVVSLQREPQQSQGSSEFGTVVKEVTQNCPLSTFRPQKGLGKKNKTMPRKESWELQSWPTKNNIVLENKDRRAAFAQMNKKKH